MRFLSLTLAFFLLIGAAWYLRPAPEADHAPSVRPSIGTAGATGLLNRQPGVFEPNLGQWAHAAKFVHRSGPMTLFLQDRGWVVDLVERRVTPETEPLAVAGVRSKDRDVEPIRGAALRMTFEGGARAPELVGENAFSGRRNYFLGGDERRWRTDVPLYASVRYSGLYPGIDLRLREAKGVPEYDLLLEPGADLASVSVYVEGASSLSIARDGSLVMQTALGAVTQPVPKTWEVLSDGSKREVACRFELLTADRFGFVAPDWDGATSLTIDPGLIWSSFLGGSGYEWPRVVSVDPSGVVTVAGTTSSSKFPTTLNAYDRIRNGGEFFVSRVDPNKTGAAQLVYSTFFGGGTGYGAPSDLSVNPNGVLTLAGWTTSRGFPTTSNAFDSTSNGGEDAFVIRLDPSKSGSAQLVYSTFFGGLGRDRAQSLSVDARGVVSVAGHTCSGNFPTTTGAYDTSFNGPTTGSCGDAFVLRLDPSRRGSAQLIYSTYLGGASFDTAQALSVAANGVLTVAGGTESLLFPTTKGAYDTTFNGTGLSGHTGFVSRLDPSKVGSAQLVYSTFLGGAGGETVSALAVGAGGVVTVVSATYSSDFPTTLGAYDRTYNSAQDVAVTRLDPNKSGAAQLVYSTFLGGAGREASPDLFVDAEGVVTVAGYTASSGFPTTSGAFDTSYNLGNGDAFVSRLDPRKTGRSQLVYSTFLGGSVVDSATGLFVDASGVVMVTGTTFSSDFPTTSGAYDTTFNGSIYNADVFVSRLDMGVALYGDRHEISIPKGGSQRLTIHAGKPHANKLYWVFGSVSGTTPGLNLLGIHIPLNLDPYTNLAMTLSNTAVFAKFKGTLDGNGLATASFHVPANLPIPTGFTFHHAYLVYDGNGIYMASNAVPLRAK